MTLAIVIVAILLLTALTLVVSRWGAREHQEELNSHDESFGPKADRPGDAESEAMGVERPGEPSIRRPGGKR